MTRFTITPMRFDTEASFPKEEAISDIELAPYHTQLGAVEGARKALEDHSEAAFVRVYEDGHKRMDIYR